MLGAPLSRWNEMSARGSLLRSGAAHNAPDSFWRSLRGPLSHSIARRHRWSRSADRLAIWRLAVQRLAVQTRLERSVQCENDQSRADQQPGDRLEIIPAAHLRLAFVAEIA